jgi:putative endonuclease
VLNKLSTVIKGKQAEEIAVKYLTNHGYLILQKNIYTPFGEIDILARKNGEYICVEVRSRDSRNCLPPELTITPVKYSRLVKSILSLNFLHNKPIRIDVITVQKKRVRRHFKNVDFPAG